MEAKCRRYIVATFASFALIIVVISLAIFTILCVTFLKPYVESKDYVNASCVMIGKKPNAGAGECDCGGRCTSTQSCGAAYVDIPSIGVVHALINFDGTETSTQCTKTDVPCGSPYDLDKMPPVGTTFFCLYDPDNHYRVIWHHQSSSVHLPLLIVSGLLFVIFTALFLGTCCYFARKGLSTLEYSPHTNEET